LIESKAIVNNGVKYALQAQTAVKVAVGNAGPAAVMGYLAAVPQGHFDP
jgi:hypothetical protein